MKLKKEKFALDDFYVGELHISYELGNLLAMIPGRDQKEKTEEYFSLLRCGALKFENAEEGVDWETRRVYHSAVTLFLKTPKGMICLHNGKMYANQGNSFYRNLVNISCYLHELDREKLKVLDIRKALFVFEHLLNSKDIPIFHKSLKEYALKDFYVGALHLKHSCKIDDENSKEKNVIERKMLYGRSYWYGYYGTDTASYDMFKSLFKLENYKLLNLHNNTAYTKAVAGDCGLSKENNMEEGYYGQTYALSSILTETQREKYQTMSLRDAFRLFKKYEIEGNESFENIKKLVKKVTPKQN